MQKGKFTVVESLQRPQLKSDEEQVCEQVLSFLHPNVNLIKHSLAFVNWTTMGKIQTGYKCNNKSTRLTYNCAHLRSTKETLTFEYDIWWYWVSVGQYGFLFTTEYTQNIRFGRNGRLGWLFVKIRLALYQNWSALYQNLMAQTLTCRAWQYEKSLILM